jgi:phage anti-repressor protein
MNELIKIQSREGIETVNARELWIHLESKREFANWIKDRLEIFVEGSDFIVDKIVKVQIEGQREVSRPVIEYYLSIDTAKHLAMLERSEVGRQIRQYFINIEKKLKSKPQSSLDILAQMVKALQDQERKQLENENRLKQIEAKIETSQNDFYSMAGYCSLRGLKVDTSKANMLGRKATKLSTEYGYEIGHVSDPRYGKVNTYHLDILSQVIDTASKTAV